MVLAEPQPLYTVKEYLALERESVERHEYLDGQIYAMAGESLEHGDICMNLSRIISTQLLGKPCRALSKDIKVRSGNVLPSRQTMKGLFSYPDLVVVCREPQFHDEYRDILLNPTVIIEVLSPSTEAYDRGEKFLRYRTHLASLANYLLVAQNKPLIDHYRRKGNNRWELSSVEGLEGSLYLTSIDCTLRLADVYDRITFPAEPAETVDKE